MTRSLETSVIYTKLQQTCIGESPLIKCSGQKCEKPICSQISLSTQEVGR